MGSPVSVVVAEIVMQHVEERALATCRTLTRRAQLVCDTPDSLRDENKYLKRVFMKNNYNADFIRRNIYRPTNADATNQNLTHVTTVTIPYIKGTSETISRILQPYNIRVAHKPTTTLRHLLTNVKDRDEPNNRQGAVYKIKCLTYSTNYFQRLTLESWYTNLEQTPLNRCQQLPAPYKRLIRDENKTDKRTSNRPT